MSVKEQAELVGKVGLLSVSPNFAVAVVVQDVKYAYGRTRYVIQPFAGKGETTVEDFRVKFEESV